MSPDLGKAELLRTPETGIRVIEAPQDDEWDRFVEAHQDPHHEQTCPWASLRGRFGWKPVGIVARENGRVVGGAMLLERRVGRWFKVGYLARGPLLGEGVDPRPLVKAIQRVAAERKWFYLAASLPYQAHGLVEPLLKSGFVERPERLPPSVWVRATLALDLTQSTEALFAGLSSHTRRDVRRGQKRGMLARHGTADDVRLFEQLMGDLCRRRGVAPNVPGGGFLDELWREFAKRGWIKLLVAEYAGEPVCVKLMIVLGQWARAWRVGWSGKHGDKYPNDFLNWEAITWAKEQGCRYLDMVGLDYQDAKAQITNPPPPPPIKCSITFHKVSLGGKILLLPGEYCYFPNPLARGLFRCGGQRVLEAAWFGRLANRLHTRQLAEGGQA